MPKQDKPETLIQLLASYRQAKFPKHPARSQSLSGVAANIASNCAVTIHYAERKLRRMNEDNEETFALCALEEEARSLKKRCASLGRGMRSKASRKEVESLRLQYDNFIGSVRHLVSLLDPSLGERLDGIL